MGAPDRGGEANQVSALAEHALNGAIYEILVRGLSPLPSGSLVKDPRVTG